MRKKRPKTKTPPQPAEEKALPPVTHEQLAEIKSLALTRQKLLQQRYSIVLNIIYIAMDYLFVWASLENVIHPYLDQYMTSELDKKLLQFNEYQQKHIVPQVMRWAEISAMLKICRECISYIQEASLQKSVATMIMMNGQFTLDQDIRAIAKNVISLDSLPKMPLSYLMELFHKVMQSTERYKQDPLYRKAVHKEEIFTAGWRNLSLVFMPAWILQIFIHYYFIEPWVTRRLNPLPFNENSLTDSHSADDRIEQMGIENQALRSTSKRNQILGYAAIVALCYWQGNINLYIFAFQMAMHTLGYLHRELYKGYQACRFSQRFAQIKNSLENAVKPRVADVIPAKHDTLETSFFTLNCPAVKNLSAFVVCQCVKNILLDYGVDISFYGRTKLIIPATAQLDSILVAKIQQSIEQSLERMQILKKIKNELVNFTQAINTSLQRTAKKSGIGLFDCVFSFYVPEKYLAILNHENLAKIFPDSHIEIEGNKITLNDCCKINTELLEQFQQQVLDITEEKMAPCADEKNITVKKIHPQPAPSPQKFLFFSAEDQKQKIPPQPKNIVVHWKSHTYRSDQASSIVAIESSNVVKNKLFVLFQLKPEDFPSIHAFEAFQATTQKALVAAKESKEGLRFISPQRVRGTDKKWFWATLDVKKLGRNFGDIRLYAEAEKSKTGETLYVVKGINPHAH